MKVLTQGGFLYGMNGACEEWFTGPAAPDTAEDPDTGERDTAQASAADALVPLPAVYGRFQARYPDAEGKLYGFTYAVNAEREPIRLTLWSRGSWSPAPGVLIPAGEPGQYIIGSGRYCVYTVDVRAHATESAGVVVGNETWFLSRDACRAARGASLVATASCSDHRPK